MSNTLKKPKNIPSSPGVYTFWGSHKNPLYIGKAVDLKKRLGSYWRKNAGSKVGHLLAEATRIEWIIAESEIDALLKEAESIKRYRPKYNVLMRDDKNYFYVGITKEEFPRIFLTHQPASPSIINYKFIGPFTSGIYLKIALKLLRRIFPYCTCKRSHKYSCLNAQIGRCPGFCCLKPSMRHADTLKDAGVLYHTAREYRKNIQNIVVILQGRKKGIIRRLKKEIKDVVQKQEFERAAVLRDQMLGLENIFAHTLTPVLRTPRSFWPKIERIIRGLTGAEEKISRVEGYDISNISGTAATGSMVVFVDGAPAKSEYRKFKIKTVHQINDVEMLKEVITRRLEHKEWTYPELMLIDGGRSQLNVADKVLDRLEQYSSSRVGKIPQVTALAKREEELYIGGQAKPILLSTLPPDVAFFFQRVRDESHRFAKKYHHKLREKQL